VKLTRDIDGYQRRRRWLGFPSAVVFKFFDDKGGYLTALITHYGFLSLFPLLLIATTVLGWLLHGHPLLAQQLIGSALAQFPIIGDQLKNTAQPLRGSAPALVTGIVVALYGGLGFTTALQTAFNQIWGVPIDARPDPLFTRLRGLALLGLLSVWVLLTTGLAALTSAAGSGLADVGLATTIAATVGSIAVNGAVFVLTYRVLTARPLSTRDVLPGAAVAALAWQALQSVGAAWVSHELRGMTAAYGLFGVVLGLLAWIYLQSLVIVLAAEVNVVRTDGLWPRAVLALTTHDDPAVLTDADRRSYRNYAQTQRFKRYERIEVDIPTRRGDERTGPVPRAE
jgi:YihY family inner membrane protein